MTPSCPKQPPTTDRSIGIPELLELTNIVKVYASIPPASGNAAPNASPLTWSTPKLEPRNTPTSGAPKLFQMSVLVDPTNPSPGFPPRPQTSAVHGSAGNGERLRAWHCFRENLFGRGRKFVHVAEKCYRLPNLLHC